MKGSPNVIDSLNRLLAAELAAMDQYFIHSEMYADWGLTKLYDRISHEFDDEKGHAKLLIERILFLEGTPCMTKRDDLRIGSDVEAMLQADLDLEYDVAEALRDVIDTCEKERDYQTRSILEKLLEDTEQDHAYWLEQQLGLIKRIGLANYQQSMM
ncbi:bacterioferritin [Neiella marina]|uniref:Bacterioferritin n=1 Tax=Neiella holothuriorum TaxID=2870530 RepID=A0ABS7EEY0_9GAMM|nr:bacterioferritin [Neiella holothuriorum]MBW8190873.1 bacterioferritin [Neiella holothuriorum]